PWSRFPSSGDSTVCDLRSRMRSGDIGQGFGSSSSSLIPPTFPFLVAFTDRNRAPDSLWHPARLLRSTERTAPTRRLSSLLRFSACTFSLGAQHRRAVHSPAPPGSLQTDL